MSDKALTLTDSEHDLEESLTGEEEEGSDDEGLNAKLCSFTVTQKTFIHQYWYVGEGDRQSGGRRVKGGDKCHFCVCVHGYVCLSSSTLNVPPCPTPFRYHCYTCGLAENTGVCSICAKVCHKDHELAYSKYGAFFCDCGARGEAHCKVSSCTAHV